MNEENLKGHGFHERTVSEQREIAKKGGKASGEARRKKADFKKTLNALLTTKVDNPEWTPILEAFGLDSTLESALNMALIKKGLSGDVKAYEAVAKYSGQSAQTDYDDEEQKIRIDRAKQARNREVGTTDSSDENIQNFLKAINPTEQELNSLFEEENTDGDETEKSSDF